jgi:hypothetical protein
MLREFTKGARAQRRNVSSRGVALVLVLAVVAMVFVLSAGYTAQQVVSVQLARNLSNRTQARMIAEAGLEMALAYVGADANWKTAKTPGAWATNISLANGVFSVRGDAGQDPNGSGVIVGNGSFTADPTQSLTLTSIGTFKEANWASQAVVTPSGSRVSSGVVVSTTVSISGGSALDSYDSTLGPYGSGNSGSNAHVATNSTQAGAVALSGGASLKGSVSAAPGAIVATVVSNNWCTYTGTTTIMPSTIPIPAITVPNLGGTPAAVTYGYAGATVSSNLHASSLTLNGGGTVKISGNVVIVVDGAFNVSNGATLEVLPNSSLKVYCSGGIALNGGTTSTAGVDGQNLDRLTLYNVGATTVTLSNGSKLNGVVVSPNAAVSVTGGFNLCGAVIAKSLTIDNGSFFHEDVRITNGTDSIPLSGGGATNKARWAK